MRTYEKEKKKKYGGLGNQSNLPIKPPYRELYGRIVWDEVNNKPILVVDYNTLGFLPTYNDTNSGTNASVIKLTSVEEYINTGVNIHPSITDFKKVHFYIADASINSGYKTFYGISHEERQINLYTYDSNGQNINESYGLCDNNGDDFYHTRIHIVIFD